MSSVHNVYARTLVGFSEIVTLLRHGQDIGETNIDIVGAVREVVEFAEYRPDLLLDIVELGRARAPSDETRYATVHAANTCLYAVVLGKILGLNRLASVEVGTCALLADVGLALLPETLTERSAPLSLDERRNLRTFMFHAVQSLIGRGHLNDVMVRRVIVAYEHHRPYRHPHSMKRVPLHPYSRIVAVADAYDAMLTPRPWRPALERDAALDVIRSGRDSKFDPIAVTALTALAELHLELRAITESREAAR